MDSTKMCRFCRARDIAPVKLVRRYDSRVQTTFLCPRCGETLDSKWSKQKKGGARNA